MTEDGTRWAVGGEETWSDHVCRVNNWSPSKIARSWQLSFFVLPARRKSLKQVTERHLMQPSAACFLSGRSPPNKSVPCMACPRGLPALRFALSNSSLCIQPRFAPGSSGRLGAPLFLNAPTLADTTLTVIPRLYLFYLQAPEVYETLRKIHCREVSRLTQPHTP